MTFKALLIVLTLVFGYISGAWFFFGAVHPCEILLVRQKDYHFGLAEKQHRDDLESLKEVARNSFPRKDYDRFVQNLEEYSNVSLREANQNQATLLELRQKVTKMTPAQCTWRAISWRTPRPATNT